MLAYTFLKVCGSEGGAAATEEPSAILIVDDDPAFRTLVAHLLERAGFRWLEATRGEEALELALGERPSLVLLDVLLPDMDGFEVCLELRDRCGRELPVIFVSGERVQAHDRAAGLLIGGDDYVVKPVDPDELLARIRRALSRSRRDARGPRHGDPAGLTPREIEVLGLLARGLDAPAIAQRLVISPKTVSSHLQSVMAKLGVHTRAQAVARAYEDGLIAQLPDVEGHAVGPTPEVSGAAAPD